jgi:hypothetical protein
MSTGPFQGTSNKGERLSEFFDFTGIDGKEKAQKPVRRFELLAWLERHQQAIEDRKLYRRAWRWLTTRQTWAQTLVPKPTQRQIARGETAPE